MCVQLAGFDSCFLGAFSSSSHKTWMLAAADPLLSHQKSIPLALRFYLSMLTHSPSSSTNKGAFKWVCNQTKRRRFVPFSRRAARHHPSISDPLSSAHQHSTSSSTSSHEARERTEPAEQGRVRARDRRGGRHWIRHLSKGRREVREASREGEKKKVCPCSSPCHTRACYEM